ncbi:TIGR02234 family membrane protein [Streptomyces zingiberis]|uniref:TIGR02234 family membrane protein n=1 Tax=Streptomyces zingiberis TaxID=2053010 RepID=A0ABX1C683_9ACTN|nr:TIGR02234 family membrane protein [Streptomyces zingiberis]NJQ02449.1 TIGR02234 family membrane protein [Streptomyces zingiberis]
MTEVPEPRSRPDADRPGAAPASGRASGARRTLAAALASGAAGAAVALIAGGQTWSHARTAAAQGAQTVSVAGRDVTGLPAALAIVGLAALVAVFAVRRAGRTAVAALLTLSGAGTIAASLLGRSATGALESEAARVTGLVGAEVTDVTPTVWPLVSAAAGLLMLLAGVLALRHGRRWPAMSGRYENPAGGGARRRPGRAAPDPEAPEELWRALDRGEDPTRDR